MLADDSNNIHDTLLLVLTSVCVVQLSSVALYVAPLDDDIAVHPLAMIFVFNQKQKDLPFNTAVALSAGVSLIENNIYQTPKL
jgi:Flp pilus assembly protein protease CpaA